MDLQLASRRLAPLEKLHHRYIDPETEMGFENPRRRTGLEDSALDELAESIKRHSLDPSGHIQKEDGRPVARPLVPLLVVKLKTSAGVIDLLWDGQRRSLASERAFGKKALIEVIDLNNEPIDPTPDNLDKIEEMALEVGGQRAGLSSAELVEVAYRRREQRKQTLEQISKVIGRSQSWVSRMLTARGKASKKVLADWTRGLITDEQFKELAGSDDATVDDVVKTRQDGNKAEARTRVKEIAESAKEKKAREKAEKLAAKERAKAEQKAKKEREREEKAAKKGKPTKAAKNGVTPVVAGDQQTLTWTPPPEVEKPKKPVVPSRVILEDLVALREKRPPTHDYVKGIVDGVRYALGLVEPSAFAKPWMEYLARVGGTAKPSKPAKKAKAKAISRPPKKALAKKPAKKAKPTKKRR